mmetsp:Transcript_126514/g.178567  ORF Transcript_126514/g.178567 Transcript_126514/m.178567 type:complete len:144 (-) Transcript_126514:12-443(-)
MAKRLLKERKMLEKDPLEYVPSIVMVNDDVFNWNCHIVGPADSPYQGGIFVLHLEFPATYPFKAPKLKFLTKVYHPSVQLETGEVCADVVGNWGPTLNAKHCLQVMYSMLQSPESDHPLEESIATQLREKPNEFVKMANCELR